MVVRLTKQLQEFALFFGQSSEANDPYLICFILPPLERNMKPEDCKQAVEAIERTVPVPQMFAHGPLKVREAPVDASGRLSGFPDGRINAGFFRTLHIAEGQD